MNERPQVPNPTPDQETISPEILAKFSAGEIPLGPDMAIRGEGKERKIIITLPPDDPSYLDYVQKLSLIIEIAINATPTTGNNEPKFKSIAIVLNLKKLHKQVLSWDVLSRKLSAFILEPHNQIPKGKTAEELLLDKTNFSDLIEYIAHLATQNAFEVILPEQQTQEDRSQK